MFTFFYANPLPIFALELLLIICSVFFLSLVSIMRQGVLLYKWTNVSVRQHLFPLFTYFNIEFVDGIDYNSSDPANWKSSYLGEYFLEFLETIIFLLPAVFSSGDSWDCWMKLESSMLSATRSTYSIWDGDEDTLILNLVSDQKWG